MTWFKYDDWLNEKIFKEIRILNFSRLMTDKTYQEWFKEIKWLKDKIILPNNERISKAAYVTSKGFNIDAFNTMLFNTYNKQHPVSDGRRYKK